MTVRAATDDPSANEVVGVTNPSGASDFLIVCEHASKFIPAEFGTLGLEGAALDSHIAWDPGALAVAEAMAAQLDAPRLRRRNRPQRQRRCDNISSESCLTVAKVLKGYPPSRAEGDTCTDDGPRRHR